MASDIFVIWLDRCPPVRELLDQDLPAVDATENCLGGGRALSGGGGGGALRAGCAGGGFELDHATLAGGGGTGSLLELEIDELSLSSPSELFLNLCNRLGGDGMVKDGLFSSGLSSPNSRFLDVKLVFGGGGDASGR